MIVSLARIECNNIRDWDSFHDEFDRVFGFGEFYGRNMEAWIDCMSCLDTPDDGMTGIFCELGKVLTIELVGVRELKDRCREQYDAIVECSAFVNWRRIDAGEQPVLALSFYS